MTHLTRSPSKPVRLSGSPTRFPRLDGSGAVMRARACCLLCETACMAPALASRGKQPPAPSAGRPAAGVTGHTRRHAGAMGLEPATSGVTANWSVAGRTTMRWASLCSLGFEAESPAWLSKWRRDVCGLCAPPGRRHNVLQVVHGDGRCARVATAGERALAARSRGRDDRGHRPRQAGCAACAHPRRWTAGAAACRGRGQRIPRRSRRSAGTAAARAWPGAAIAGARAAPPR